MTSKYLPSQYGRHIGQSHIRPQCVIWLVFPEILCENLTCYHLLSVTGNSKMMHCWTLLNMCYSWQQYHIPEPLSEALSRSTGFTDRSLSPGRSPRWGSGGISGSRWSGNRTLIARAGRRAIKWSSQKLVTSQQATYQIHWITGCSWVRVEIGRD